jgi:hypothetical protein
MPQPLFSWYDNELCRYGWLARRIRWFVLKPVVSIRQLFPPFHKFEPFIRVVPIAHSGVKQVANSVQRFLL